MWVTLDAGNSRLKARAWGSRVAEPGFLSPLSGVMLGGDDAQVLAGLGRWFSSLGEPFEATLVSVGPKSREQALRAVLRERATRFVEEPTPGLEVECEAPETVGLDRLWAARGALSHVGTSAIVVDAGTALTVDAVRRRDGIDAFLGGAIAPGPELGARALGSWATQLPRVEPVPGVPALGRDTGQAIRSGLAVGFRGAAGELVRCIVAEAGLGDVPILLTGGARAYLVPFPHVFPRAPEECGDLIHLGLLERAFGDEAR